MMGSEKTKAPSAPVIDTAADEAKIKALEEQFVADVNAHNLDAIMSHYSNDVLVFDVVPPRQYVGADAYRKDWEGLLGEFKTYKLDISDLSVSSDGQLAWSHSIQHLGGTQVVKKKTHKIDMTVRVTDVYKKINGEWKIVHEHVSMPIDLDHGAKADLSSKP
jgi:ketosteroid isomerase-like protein